MAQDYGERLRIPIIPWRGSLLPLGGEAAPIVFLRKTASMVSDGYAAEREQAPSPRSVYLSRFIPCCRLREQALSHRRSAVNTRSVEFNLDSSSLKNSPPPAR
jgi:hypothetical protein